MSDGKDPNAMDIEDESCRYHCNEDHVIEDSEGNPWPCPIHGESNHVVHFNPEVPTVHGMLQLMRESAAEALLQAYGIEEAPQDEVIAIVNRVLRRQWAGHQSPCLIRREEEEMS